jgi:aryl-alcohol dehydrogenase-like predicted oxidoreductase
MMEPELCLGTVQFGLPYGITNVAGRVSQAEARRILVYASSARITLLDTAQAYGDAEGVVGSFSRTADSLRIISKLPAQLPEPWGPEQWALWEKEFQASLQRLRVGSLEGFLLHNAADLRRADGDRLLDWLLSLQERQLVKRIGVSIYTAADLDGLPLDRLQLVQLPLSLYDQRLLQDGTVASLHAAGVALHARSVFLQGLLLQDASRWPSFITPAFARHHDQLRTVCTLRGFSCLEAALGFVQGCGQLEAVLVGVTRVRELDSILTAWRSGFSRRAGWLSDSPDWAWDNVFDLDPRCWPSK